MRLTPIERLVPEVREIERLVFEVKSRSRSDKTHRVDMERRDGLGFCFCEDCRINGNVDCAHLQKVRKYLAVKVSQSVILKYGKTSK